MTLLPYGGIAGGYISEHWLKQGSYSNEEGHARSGYYKRMIEHHGGWDKVLKLLGEMSPIAKSLGISVAQLGQRWLLSRPGVEAVICGLTLDERKIDQNVAVPNIDIDRSQLEVLTKLSDDLFCNSGDIYSYERQK